MHYSQIKVYDIANGVGVRTSLFVSGCSRHCPGCFNSETWDYDHGSIFDKSTVKYILDTLKPDYIAGLSVLGGEPLDDKNRGEVLNLIRAVKQAYPQKDIWMWTGYIFDELELYDETIWNILSNIDVLVDGPYEESNYDILARFRGSTNQRIIDIPKTLENKKVVIWTDGPVLGTRTSTKGEC